MMAIKGLLLKITRKVPILLSGNFLNDRRDFSSDYIYHLKTYHLLKSYAHNTRMLNTNSI
jgi:hypothetical protein